MARDDNDKIEVEIDDRDIDRTAKKLRNLDKLLQQTHRRAALLGKTRIKPALTLDDRFTSATQKVEDTLKRLHRMTVQPTVKLSDRVTSTALRLRASLAAVTAEPWQVSIGGVDWEVVVGDSFSKWMKSDGVNTLRRISNSIGTTLRDGLNEFVNIIPGQAPELPQRPSLNRSMNRSNKMTNKTRLPGFQSDGSYYSVRDFMSNLSVKKKQTTHGGNRYSSSSARGSFDSTDRKEITPLSLLVQLSNELLKDRITDYANDKFAQWSSRFKGMWQEKWPKLRSKIEPKIGTKVMGNLTDWGTKAGKFFGKGKPFLNKIGGVAGVLFDGIEIAMAKTPREKYQKVTSSVLSTVIGGYLAGGLGGLFSVIGPEGTAAGALLGGAIGGVAGGYLGDWAGGFIYDLLHGKIKPKPLAYSDRVMAPSVQGVTRPGINLNVPRVMGTPVPNYYQLPEEVRSKIGGAGYNQATTPVNVSLSEGSINLTVNKEKLDYQKLAETAGWKIANEVRFAMQNLK